MCPQVQELDDATRKKLENILQRLDDDDPPTREAAQKEMEVFLDNDAKANFVRAKAKNSSAEVKFRCEIALEIYEDKKHGSLIYRGKDHNIWIIRSDGSGEKQLTEGQNNYTPSWSPDGQKILFASAKEGPIKIFIMNYDGKDKKQLTTGNASDLFPKFSPDGKKILFERYATKSSIYIIDSDGTNEQKLSEDDNDDSLPTFSPDGKKIAFVSKRTGKWRLYIMDVDGKNQKQLISSGGEERSPVFSPDGKRIAFASRTEDDKWRICSVDLDGKNLKKITEGDESYHSPTFSGDGNKIAFMSSNQGDNWRLVETDGQIYIMSTDGKDPKKLIGGFYPSWGPSKLPIRKKKD